MSSYLAILDAQIERNRWKVLEPGGELPADGDEFLVWYKTDSGGYYIIATEYYPDHHAVMCDNGNWFELAPMRAWWRPLPNPPSLLTIPGQQ